MRSGGWVSIDGDPQAGSGDLPIAARSAHRDPQAGSRFFLAESGKVAKFDELGFAGGMMGKVAEGEIHGQDLVRFRIPRDQGIGEFDRDGIAAALLAPRCGA
jgi:hypothetical protein